MIEETSETSCASKYVCSRIGEMYMAAAPISAMLAAPINHLFFADQIFSRSPRTGARLMLIRLSPMPCKAKPYDVTKFIEFAKKSAASRPSMRIRLNSSMRLISRLSCCPKNFRSPGIRNVLPTARTVASGLSR